SQSVDSTGSGSYNQITYFVYDLNKPSGFPGQSLDPTAVDAAVLEFVDPDGSGPEPVSLAERLLVGPDLAGLFDQVYAQESVSTGAVAWLLADNLVSTRDAVDANGNVLGHFVYNSFGQLVSGPTSVTRFLFTGRWTDPDTSLQYNGNRWYDPAAGRWISEDPAGLAYDTNASRYVGNQPTMFVDPTGLAESPSDSSAPLVWRYSVSSAAPRGASDFAIGGAAYESHDVGSQAMVRNGEGDGNAPQAVRAGVLQIAHGEQPAALQEDGRPRPFNPHHDLPPYVNLGNHYYFGRPYHDNNTGQTFIPNANYTIGVFGPNGSFIGNLPLRPGILVPFYHNGRPIGMTWPRPRPFPQPLPRPVIGPPQTQRPLADQEPIGHFTSEPPVGHNSIMAEAEAGNWQFNFGIENPPEHPSQTVVSGGIYYTRPWRPGDLLRRCLRRNRR
ncbi:MAG TPA: RHS repeat-associated core domain-containing protein, partial [Lacipirellulaceae bacterium]|nr:RHS repeat-associated core domain-containing protein [Lacipirellulaceae bacterium]